MLTQVAHMDTYLQLMMIAAVCIWYVAVIPQAVLLIVPVFTGAIQAAMNGQPLAREILVYKGATKSLATQVSVTE
jgi:hypothetical protein